MRQADHIREFVLDHVIKPARSHGRSLVSVRAGDVHRDMGLRNAMPAVCSALGSDKFLGMAAVETIARSGPPNGSNALFTFKLLDKHPVTTLTQSTSPDKPVARSKNSGAATLRDLSNALVLVACVKTKLDHPAPARDLYISTFFQLARRFVEARQADWRILSALYGLVEPDTLISPYDRTLNQLGVRKRREWAQKTLVDLIPLTSRYDAVVFLAGMRYREFLIPELVRYGVSVQVPMQGLRQGEQLAWLARHQ